MVFKHFSRFSKTSRQQRALLRSASLILLAVLTCIIIPLSSERVLSQEVTLKPSQLVIEGKKLYDLGQFDAAARVWQQAADGYEQIGDIEKKSQSLINTAEALQSGGRYLKACDRLIRALQIETYSCRQIIQENQTDTIWQEFKQQLQTIPDTVKPLTKSYGLRSFGDVLQKLGNPELSLQVLQFATKISSGLSSPITENAILLSLGNAQTMMGDKIKTKNIELVTVNKIPISCPLTTDNPSAVNFYQQADASYLQAANQSDSVLVWIQAQLNRLSIGLKTNTVSISPDLLSKIAAKLTTLPANQATIYAEINFAKSLVCLQQNPLVSTTSWKTIINILTTAQEQAKTLGDKRAESYVLGYLGWLYQQKQQLPEALLFTQKALFLAQNIQAKDILYQWQWQLGYLLEVQGKIADAIASYSEAVDLLQFLRQDLVGINAQVQFSFQTQIRPVYEQLVKLRLQLADTNNAEPNNLQQVRNTIESFQILELENFLRESCLEAQVELDRIIDAEDSTTAVIYPIILEQQLAIILKLPQQEKLYYYKINISQQQLESTVNTLSQYLPDITRRYQINQLSQRLYNSLILPLEKELSSNNIETLVFVLSDSLRNIPMAVLYDGNQYLIEKYAISLAPSLKLIPSPSIEPSEVKVLAAGISQQHQIEGVNFPSLTNVKEELNMIQSQTFGSEQLLNDKFTKTNLQQKLESSAFSILHLATHSQFSSNFQNTFILAWDKLLTINDLVDLIQLDSTRSNLNPIELLILSSCETAKGDPQAGLGIAGIAVRAGARSTLATLWSIDDASTAEIMNQFYQQLNQGMSKAKALQQAQLAFLTREKRPFFWASFVLIGNWL